jgi:hypothetical protein
MHRRRLQVGLAAVQGIVVTIRKPRCAFDSAHSIRANCGCIGAARTSVAARSTIRGRSDIHFAAIAIHVVAIVPTRHARFDGAHALHASSICIRESARLIAIHAVFRRAERRLATIDIVAVAIGSSGAARIVYALAIVTVLEFIARHSARAAVVRIVGQLGFAAIDGFCVAIGKPRIAWPDAACAALA